MTHRISITTMALLAMFAGSLSCTTSSSDDNPNSLGGDTNVPFSQVGNQISFGQLVVGSSYYTLNTQVAVTKNSSGVTTFKVTSNVPNSSKVQSLVDLLPAGYKDSNGGLNGEFNVKITADGMLDYFNKDGKPQLLVKYDANVGDVYRVTKSDGTTITRTVTQKSTTDDFDYGLYLIKTITVEQDSRIPGVSKIVLKFNHKFGLVYVEVVMEDGSKISSYLYSQNT